MSFFVMHLDGSHDSPESVDAFPALLGELAFADEEHGDVAVEHDSGWGLTFSPWGVIWEDVENFQNASHIEGMSRDERLQIMGWLAAGELDRIHALPWVDGYGHE